MSGLVSAGLKNVSEQLGLGATSAIALSEAEAKDATKAAAAIKNMMDELNKSNEELCEMPQGGMYQEAESFEQLVCRLNGGSLLHGISFGDDADTFGHRAPAPLIDKPCFIDRLNPSLPNKVYSEFFQSTESVTKFHTVVESAGRSFAAGLKASGWGAVIEANHAQEKKASDQTTTRNNTLTATLTQLQTKLHPLFAFHLPHDQLRLTPTAEAKALGVTNPASAIAFFRDFGTHLQCGLNHIGGSMTLELECRTRQETTVDDIKHVMSEASKSGFGGGYSGFGGEASMSVELKSAKENGEQTTDTKHNNSATIKKTVRSHDCEHNHEHHQR